MVRKKKEVVWERYLRAFLLLFILSICASFVFRTLSLLGDSSFDSISRFNIAISSPSGIAVFTIESKTKRAAVLELSGNILSDDPSENAGSYQIGKTYKLGSLDGRGGSLFSQSIEYLLGAPIHGFLVLEGGGRHYCSESKNILTLVCSFYLFSESIKGNIDTDMTVIDITRIMLAQSVMRVADIEKAVLLKEIEYVEEELADGSKVIRIRESNLDRLSRNFFSDSKFFNEALGVSFMNGTEVAGYGAKVARIFSNAGLHIVSVSTPKEAIGESLIEYRSSVSDSYTLEGLKRHLGLPSKVNDELTSEDVRIYLGEDIW